MKLLSLTTVVATLMTSVLARSSVYLVNNNPTESLSTTPEVSLNGFSIFYSHMMDATANHPAVLLQNAAGRQAFKGAEEISSLVPESKDIFTRKVNANLMVIISGVQSAQDIISTREASFFVSNDEPESYSTLVQNTFEELEDATFTSYKDQKAEIRRGQDVIPIASRLPEESFEYFCRDFDHLDPQVFNMDNEVDRLFVTEVEDIREIYSSDRKYEPTDIRFVQINTLEKLGQEYGVQSKQYKEAQLVLRDLFEKFVIPHFQELYSNGVSTFILTPFTQQSKERRAIQMSVAPVADTCFKTIADCKNGTLNCSGNGQCTQVDTCFTCQCKSSAFVGESCQYVNAVSDFQLLFWTSVLLIVITASVVVCVYQSGNIVDGGIIMAQSLPKQD